MSQVKNMENTPIFDLADFAQFCAIAFVWSWGLWLGSSFIPPEIPVFRELLFYGASFGPGVAAVFIVILSSGFSGLVGWLKSNLRFDTGWRWILIALFFPIVLIGVAALLYRGMGGTLVPPAVQGHFLLVLLNIVLIFLVGGPIAEEFGWRGFGQKVLQSRFDIRLASIILGVIWTIWHLPLFFMKDSVQSEIPFTLFLLSALCLSVLSGWLLNRSGGGIIPVLLFHTAVNASPMFVAFMPSQLEGDIRLYGISVILLLISACFVLFDRRSLSTTVMTTCA